MKNNALGRTDLLVSDICLGTMTWGTQTTEQDAHTQIDMALAQGINFIDTAEMYPVTPVRAETVGRTEEIVGSWIAKSNRRDEIVLATKITGGNGGFCRDGEPISGAAIDRALDGSLRRLQTDYIDLYQLHWPNRGSYAFRQNWDFTPSKQDTAAARAHMQDVLASLSRHVQAGRIRHIGLSNESAWGTMMWLHLAEQMGAPRMVSVQNEYSLLFRLFDTDMAELSAHEQAGLLAYSPLAAGLLTGKYRGGACPDGSRLSIGRNGLGGRATPRAHAAVDAYLALAASHGLDPVHMALAFCRSRPFTTSTICGATTVAQLKHILAGKDLSLSDAVLKDIGALHRAHPMPY
ncbi:MAG: aldo/keto reductase [Rhodobacteraceae bacterium]|nr:aldo/keto reductase [Paracoccaceae bacterium]